MDFYYNLTMQDRNVIDSTYKTNIITCYFIIISFLIYCLLEYFTGFTLPNTVFLLYLLAHDVIRYIVYYRYQDNINKWLNDERCNQRVIDDFPELTQAIRVRCIGNGKTIQELRDEYSKYMNNNVNSKPVNTRMDVKNSKGKKL